MPIDQDTQPSGLAFPAIILLSLFIGVSTFISIKTNPSSSHKTAHKCGYRLCPMQNDTAFTGQHTDCEAGSDCYILDSLHFAHPAMSYDQLDSMLFSPAK